MKLHFLPLQKPLSVTEKSRPQFAHLLKVMIAWLLVFYGSSTIAQEPFKEDFHVTQVKKVSETPTIDGAANENDWAQQDWLPLNEIWLGEAHSAADFSGRYKLLWSTDALYLLVEITDDVLFDQHPNPLTNWWDDDCLEIFVDENNSGGNHQFNHSAFAYHVSLEGQVVDMSTNKTGKLYNGHVISSRTTKNQTSLWELKILLYNDNFSDKTGGSPVSLKSGKKVGFALAYCDNDQSEHRENFIGSLKHEGFNQNQGWIDASIFGTLILTD